MTLPRARLMTRLLATEPRLVRLCAPPGYGKSALAGLLARRFDRHSFCDCAGVATVAEFAGRAMSALAGESQTGDDPVALSRLRLHVAEADGPAWSRALLDAWKVRREPSLFVLTRAEAIADKADVLAVLGDLLAARPAERVIAISTREPLPVRFAHYFAPHEVLTLTRAELRLDAEEAQGIFEGSGLPQAAVARIVRLAAGRPVVLLLLALFAHYDADVERLLDRLEGVAGEHLHAYLADQVLSGFTPDMLSTILATAAIPDATLEDICAATGIRHATAIMDRLLRLPGFISSATGAYQTHPVLLEALRARHSDELAEALLQAAAEYERSGDYLRAAELYAARGDERAAAGALERLSPSLLHVPSARLIDALARVGMPVLCEHPNLWIAMLPYRRRSIETTRLYAEARRLLHSVSPEASPSLHRRLRVRLAMLAHELELLDEARALLEPGGPGGAFDEAPEEQRLLLMTSAIVAAKLGRFAEADECVDESDAVLGARHVRFENERAQIALEKARFSGDWNGVLKLAEETLYAAQSGGLTSRIIEAARAVAQAAWYCNDDARVVTAHQMIEDCGGIVHEPAWHAAFAATTLEEADRLLDRAIDEVDSSASALPRIVVRVAAALLLPAQRCRLLEARALAQPIESPPLHASLELLIDSREPGDAGIFKNLAARIARSPLKVSADVLSIDVLRGRVRRGSDELHVSDRGFELLAALALMPGGTSKEELAAAIWPSLDGEAAANSLKMCVSRARAQIGEREAILSTKSGYALSERVAIDVRAFERLLRDVRSAAVLGEAARSQVEAATRALSMRDRSHTAGWAWFATHATRLEELQRELMLVLAKDALRREEREQPKVAEPA